MKVQHPAVVISTQVLLDRMLFLVFWSHVRLWGKRISTGGLRHNIGPLHWVNAVRSPLFYLGFYHSSTSFWLHNDIIASLVSQSNLHVYREPICTCICCHFLQPLHCEVSIYFRMSSWSKEAATATTSIKTVNLSHYAFFEMLRLNMQTFFRTKLRTRSFGSTKPYDSTRLEFPDFVAFSFHVFLWFALHLYHMALYFSSGFERCYRNKSSLLLLFCWTIACTPKRPLGGFLHDLFTYECLCTVLNCPSLASGFYS